MFAIIETCGKQYRVQAGDLIEVDQFSEEAGATVSLDRVLMVSGDELKIGMPTVAGASVTAKVVDHHLGEKRITFKYMRTRRRRRKVGYRPRHTTLEIVSING